MSDKKTPQLVCCIMGPGKIHFAEMCLESVKTADKILYWCSNTDEFDKNFKNKGKHNFILIDNKWDENDKATNGKCRNRYLDYLKQNYSDDWALVLDEDEIVEDLNKIKEFIQIAQMDIYNVKMRHFIGDLGHEDATLKEHWVPNRLFRISKAKKYPLHSHPVLEGIKEYKQGSLNLTTIWHLGHLPVEYLDYILKRYKQHQKDSKIHTQEYLKDWKYRHFFGKYLTKEISILELPEQICKRYEIDKDEFYFMDDLAEIKHPIMVKQWYDYFKPKSVLDIGCGRGIYLYFWEWFIKDFKGIDKSKYAIENPICANNRIKNKLFNEDILKFNSKRKYNLVTAIDVLEHIKYEDLDNVFKKINFLTNKNILFSIPFKEDINLGADKTHIIKESKDWWIEKISKYFKIKETPKDWMFKEQLIIGEKNEK